MTDYYKILNVNFAASETEIKKRFRKLATIHHPDKNAGSKKSEEYFKVIINAYETLSDKKKRAVYDFKYKQYFQPKRTETNRQNNTRPKTETESKQRHGQTQYNHPTNGQYKKQTATKPTTNYVFWLFIIIVVIIYLFNSNKKTTTGNPKADQQLEEQKTENRQESGEIDFGKK